MPSSPTPSPLPVPAPYRFDRITTFAPEQVVGAASAAARAIELVYERADLGIKHKPDGSVVTDADFASHEVLGELLPRLHPALYVSEEGIPPAAVRAQAEEIWLVDPLDNTKDFARRRIERSGINIALVRDGVPVLGYLHYFAPNRGILGAFGEGAFEVRGDTFTPLAPPVIGDGPLRFVAYKPDMALMTTETRTPHEKLQVDDRQIVHRPLLPLRLRAIMLGEADVYIEPRRIHEWDVAPAFAVIRAQGGSVLSLDTGEPVKLNSPSLDAPPFVAIGPGIDCESIMRKLRAG